MTTEGAVTADAAHAAATTAIEELYAEAMSALDALFRSFETPAAPEEESEPVQDGIVGPPTLELPRRAVPPAVAAAA